MIRKAAVLIFLTLPLCACLTAEQQEAQNRAALAKMNAEDDTYCQSYGVEKGSPAYVSCRNNLTQVRAGNAAVAAANNAAMSRAMVVQGTNMMNQGFGGH